MPATDEREPMPYPIPYNEVERLAALQRLDVLDSMPERSFDDIALLASYVAGTPMALVTLIDEHRQWFKVRLGLEVVETPRDVAFCSHTILNPDKPMEVPDARLDPRFADNPFVTGSPCVRYYFGVPLQTEQDIAIGTLCVVDTEPRQLSATQKEAMQALARQVVAQLELRLAKASLEEALEKHREYAERLERYQRVLEHKYASLQVQKDIDSLTGLANRQALDNHLDDCNYRFQRDGTPFSLLLIDVDHFKNFNDSFGHPAGDRALREVALAIAGQLRVVDFAARFGGEEFAVVLPNTKEPGTVVLGERIRRAVESVAWNLRPITVSVGGSTMGDSLASVDELLQVADEALYQAKSAGRNCLVYMPGSPGAGDMVQLQAAVSIDRPGSLT